MLFHEVGLVGDALRRLIGHCWQQNASLRCTFSVVTAELSLILQAAVEVIKYGSVRAGRSQFMQSLRPNMTGATAGAAVGAGKQSATPTVRKLEDLSVDEVGTLMDSIKLETLKEPFKVRKVSGQMLSFCEEADELQTEDFGVSNKTLARGLMRKIAEWKEKGVPSI